eukprot:TRINITY_DN46949_c0_g1_i1.p1 TRINITY_DN46949_c0_g1~~TRINITY_DN46949_c0_g1_i1.p1  ORF type:complete len:1335 (-),score=293.73 TRINITY_DN46949_c0_g1_i1:45-4049(-)
MYHGDSAQNDFYGGGGYPSRTPAASWRQGAGRRPLWGECFVTDIGKESLGLSSGTPDNGWADNSRSSRVDVKWNSLCLCEAPNVNGPRRDAKTKIRWRLHCVGSGSKAMDFASGPRNTWLLGDGADDADDGSRNRKGQLFSFRTGIADVTMGLRRGLRLRAEVSSGRSQSQRGGSRLLRFGVSGNLCICVEHREETSAFCPDAAGEVEELIALGSRSSRASSSSSLGQLEKYGAVATVLEASRSLQAAASPSATVHEDDKSALQAAATLYAAAWRSPVELEAATNSVGEAAGHTLFDVHVTWTSAQPGECYGSFEISSELKRAHKIKFRSLLQGGEFASSWVCVRRYDEDYTLSAGLPTWVGHGAVVRASYVQADFDLGLDEDDRLAAEDVKIVAEDAVRVVFRLVPEGTHVERPVAGRHVLELIAKSLPDSCMAMAISPPMLLECPLAFATVLSGGVLPGLAGVHGTTVGGAVKDTEEKQLQTFRLNPSQEAAVRAALTKPLSLVHGPPGTGKTRTTSVLATLWAARNMRSGESRCVLFCAPTNRAVDCAAQFVARLCEMRAEDKLRQRWADGEVCAICLAERPDMVTACSHAFHKRCLAQSLEAGKRCPTCRQVVKQEDTGLRVLRVYGADMEKRDFPCPRKGEHATLEARRAREVPEDMRRFSWHWRSHAAVEDEEATQEALACRRAYRAMLDHGTHGKRAGALRQEYFAALARARGAEIRGADIIFATCTSCRRAALAEALASEGAPCLRQVIVDEAGQATEPEALVPLTLAFEADQVCFFGDHRQLRPVLKSQKAQAAGLEVSLFERLAVLAEDGTEDFALEGTFLLAQQYRMAPSISVFPAQYFYGGLLQDDASVSERCNGLLLHPKAEGRRAAVYVWDVGKPAGSSPTADDSEDIRRVRTAESGVKSRSHEAEGAAAVALALEIAERAGPRSVAVLCWYSAQAAVIKRLIDEHESGSYVHVGSIATAQGSEWDYVLLSTVRRDTGDANRDGYSPWRLGILSDDHVMNVALTRARLGLVVLGSVATLNLDEAWAAFLRHCSDEKVIIDERPMVRTDEQAVEEALKRGLRLGTDVVVQGLQNAPELNGMRGVVTSDGPNESGRWQVDIGANETLRRLNLKPANISWAPPEVAPGMQAAADAPLFSGLKAVVLADGGSVPRDTSSVEFSRMVTVHRDQLHLESGGSLPSGPIKRNTKVRISSVPPSRLYDGADGLVKAGAKEYWQVEVSRSFCMEPGGGSGSGELEISPGANGLEYKRVATPGKGRSFRWRSGIHVMLHGLQGAADLNGEWGVIVSDAANAEERWDVEIMPENAVRIVRIKAGNLAPQVA